MQRQQQTLETIMLNRRAFLTVLVAVLAFSLSAADKIKIACVGDSITFGAGVEQREVNCYPVVLGKILGDKYETKNFGNSGSTLLKNGDKPYWKQKEFQAATDYAPNIVVIKLGTNDSKPQNWKHKDQFEADLVALATHFASLPTKPKIYLCLPVPVYETKWGINEPVVKSEVIPIIQKVAKEKNLATIDLYTALSGMPELFPDKIHPNAAGAKLMAETIAKTLAH
jgi:acyl-CoA thioesterase I